MRKIIFASLILAMFSLCAETALGNTNSFRKKENSKKGIKAIPRSLKEDAPPSQYPRWVRAIILTAVISEVDGEAAVTFHNRSKRKDYFVKVGETIPNTLAKITSIDADNNIVTIEEKGKDYVLPLRVYQPEKKGLSINKDGKIKLNFEATDLRTVLLVLSELTGESLILDRSVKGPVTVITPLPVSREEAIKIIYSALEINKYTIVRDGKIAKVIKSGDAKQSPILITTNRAEDIEVNDLIRAQVVFPKHILAFEVKRFLDPMMTKGCGQVVINEGANNLILIDTGTNIKRLMEIIEIIDKPTPVKKEKTVERKLYTYKFKHAYAGEVCSILHNLFPNHGTYNIAVSEDTNTLLIRATENIFNSIIEIIKKIDVPKKEEQNALKTE